MICFVYCDTCSQLAMIVLCIRKQPHKAYDYAFLRVQYTIRELVFAIYILYLKYVHIK